jgi:hypothetical protein
VLLEGFQAFIGQSNVLLWGKAPYAPPGSIVTDVNAAPFDEFPTGADVDANSNGVFDRDQYNGGVAGIVHYSTTRAENDPRWGGAEVWEPGIPGVRVQLWSTDRTRLLNEVTTDSWDDALPEGCPGGTFNYQGTTLDCYDGLRNYNQVRPALFDGGYQILTQKEPIPGQGGTWLTPVEERDNAMYREVPLPAGKYIAKVIVPAGYQIVGEEDKNVDFGVEFVQQQFYLRGTAFGDDGPSDPPPVPSVEDTPLAVPFCVGALHEVPMALTLFPGVVKCVWGRDASLVRREAGGPAAGPEPGRELLRLHRGSRGGSHHRLRARRHRQRARPELAAVRREVRAAVPAHRDSRLEGTRGQPYVQRRVRQVQRARPEHVLGGRSHAERHVAEHDDRVHQLADACGRLARSILQPEVQPLLLHAPVHARHDDLPRHAGAADGRVRGCRPVPGGHAVPE